MELTLLLFILHYDMSNGVSMSNFLTFSQIPIFINYLALPIALVALYLRGRAMMKFDEAIVTKLNVKTISMSNTIWNLAILLWLLTNGIIWGRRLAAPSMEYFESPWVQVKIGLLLLIFLLELKPVVIFAFWRFGWFANKSLQTQLERSQLQSLVRINYFTLGLTALLLLVEVSHMSVKHLY